MTCDSYTEIDLLCIDIGNSRLKLFANGEIINSISNKSNLELKLLNFLSNNPAQKVIYSSVNQNSENILCDVLQRLSIPFSKAKDLVHSYSKIDFSAIEGMGIDRKLSLIAAYAISGKAPLITIDFGTCITVNIIDSQRKCLGGNIFPGLQTQANALNHFTSALPRILIKYTNNLIGDNTDDAILTAIIRVSLEGLNAHIKKIMASYFSNEEVQIYFTGGISSVAKYHNFDFPFTVDPLLVLKGMHELNSVDTSTT